MPSLTQPSHICQQPWHCPQLSSLRLPLPRYVWVYIDKTSLHTNPTFQTHHTMPPLPHSHTRHPRHFQPSSSLKSPLLLLMLSGLYSDHWEYRCLVGSGPHTLHLTQKVVLSLPLGPLGQRGWCCSLSPRGDHFSQGSCQLPPGLVTVIVFIGRQRDGIEKPGGQGRRYAFTTGRRESS